nr:molybdopterin-dependent oxidoreductase [Pseudohalocynthiibacter aestuariivivens]
MVNSDARVRRPAVREGYLDRDGPDRREKRGQESFIELSWNDALDLAARQLGEIYAKHGPSAVFGGSYGWASAGRFHHAQSQIHRFLNCLGGYSGTVGTYSHAALEGLCPYVVGDFERDILKGATSWPVLSRHTELFVLFGGVAIKNTQIAAGGATRHIVGQNLNKARANGAVFVNISPQKSDCPDALGADWLAIRPGTDTAMMLALAFVLWTENLADINFLKRYCVGFEQFLPYLLGHTDRQPKNPGWAARITGIPANRIRTLARRMARRRCLINMAWSLQRADHGEQPAWMIVVLAAMLGQIGLPGGGFGFGYASDNGTGHPVRRFRYGALPQGENPVKTHIPVARIADALLNPGARYQFMGEMRNYPDIRAIYWAGGNPFHHHQDLNRLVQAFRQPETVIVNEPFWTSTARHADIVFPATTPLERHDIAMGSWDTRIVAMEQVIEPVGESRNDFDIFSAIAERLDVGQKFHQGQDAEAWIKSIWAETRANAHQSGLYLPTIDELRTKGIHDNAPEIEERVLLEAFRADPIAHPLSTPSGKIEIFSETIAAMVLKDCAGHPTWIKPSERLGAPNETEFPLHLISNQPPNRLHSQFDPGKVSLEGKVNGREALTMHPLDANQRGLSDGDIVLVFNKRGACYAGVVLSNAIRQGCVQLPTGAWYDPIPSGPEAGYCRHGNPNVLTKDFGTSALAQGPTPMTAMVEIVKAEGAPEPSPFSAPVKVKATEESQLPQ